MPIYSEEWNPDDYVMRGFQMTTKLLPNHQGRTKNLPFDFVDYNVNKGVPCLIYEKTLKACFNHFGFYTREFQENKDCVDANSWFPICVRNHQIMATYKKYNPEGMVTERSSSPIYSINDVL